MLAQLEQLHIRQQPDWANHPDYAGVISELSQRDGLVDATATDLLHGKLAKVQAGEAFLLHGGPCAETFLDGRRTVESDLKTMLAMNMVLMYAGGVEVVKVGRRAGQYGKPRSSDTEDVDGLLLPSHRGVIVNGSEPTVEARQHDPNRMLAAYDHANATLRTIERLSRGGFADIKQMQAWNVEFAEQSAQRERYEMINHAIARAIRFMEASGVTNDNLRALHEADVFTSHEGLIKDYEIALTRETDGVLYDTSAHMLWIGERTRGLDEFHVNFFAEIANPVASKIGPKATREEVVGLCERLNPDKIPGRLTLITRMGKSAVVDVLPNIIGAVRDAGHEVVWVCDPMHGNTITHSSGQKTRLFDDIAEELTTTFQVHRAHDSRLGGMSLELTGQNVTECIGGSGRNSVNSLDERYDTTCDPRTNADQSLELAFIAAEELVKDSAR